VSTPLSPGARSREQDACALLLEINTELLYETIQLQTSLAELKKEHAAASQEGNAEQEKKMKDEEQQTQQDCYQ